MQKYRRDAECVFCLEISRPDGPENLVVYRGELNYLILNRFPYNSGHLMVVPYEHKSTLEALDASSRADMMELANLATRALQTVYNPQGFNLGLNIGDAGGAGIMEHVHMHILPRWSGDTNFISTLGGTRVLPETLDETRRRLHDEIDRIIRNT